MDAMNAKRGQPPKGDKAKSEYIMVRLTPADKKALGKASVGVKGGMAALARRFILDSLKRLTRRKK